MWIGETKKEHDAHNASLSDEPTAYRSKFRDSDNILARFKYATVGYVKLWGRWRMKYIPDEDVRNWKAILNVECKLKHDGDRTFYADYDAPVRAIEVRLYSSRRLFLCPKRRKFWTSAQFSELDRDQLPTLKKYINWGATYMEYFEDLRAQIEKVLAEGAVHIKQEFGLDGDKAESITENFVNQYLDELGHYRNISIREKFDQLDEFYESEYGS